MSVQRPSGQQRRTPVNRPSASASSPRASSSTANIASQIPTQTQDSQRKRKHQVIVDGEVVGGFETNKRRQEKVQMRGAELKNILSRDVVGKKLEWVGDGKIEYDYKGKNRKITELDYECSLINTNPNAKRPIEVAGVEVYSTKPITPEQETLSQEPYQREYMLRLKEKKGDSSRAILMTIDETKEFLTNIKDKNTELFSDLTLRKFASVLGDKKSEAYKDRVYKGDQPDGNFVREWKFVPVESSESSEESSVLLGTPEPERNVAQAVNQSEKSDLPRQYTRDSISGYLKDLSQNITPTTTFNERVQSPERTVASASTSAPQASVHHEDNDDGLFFHNDSTAPAQQISLPVEVLMDWQKRLDGREKKLDGLENQNAKLEDELAGKVGEVSDLQDRLDTAKAKIGQLTASTEKLVRGKRRRNEHLAKEGYTFQVKERNAPKHVGRFIINDSDDEGNSSDEEIKAPSKKKLKSTAVQTTEIPEKPKTLDERKAELEQMGKQFEDLKKALQRDVEAKRLDDVRKNVFGF